ncbi:glycosyltransferase family 4 protein, partial [Candidatus Peregrinibacteria bacterium]|nr:glycosyltransferase family 4 protein [Candidatus Peregrinibacteria bacterium]
MRILQITDSFTDVGGAETHFFSLVALLKKNGNEVFTLHFDSYGKKTPSGLKVKESSSWFLRRFYRLFFNPFMYSTLRKYITSLHPDIIHIHKNNKYPSMVLLACRNYRTVHTVHGFGAIFPFGSDAVGKRNSLSKSITLHSITLHSITLKDIESGFFHLIKSFYYYPFYHTKARLEKKIVTRFISPSKILAEAMHKAGYQHITILPNFIDMDYWQFRNKQPPPYKILFVGKLSKIKGVEYLILALSLLVESFPEITLTIVGDGDQRKYLEGLSRRLHLKKNVVFTGNSSSEKIRSYYYAHTLFVLPSICMENYPVTLCEAMACGVPCIGTKIGGIQEIIKHNSRGFLVEPCNHKDLARAIKILLNDRKLQVTFAENSRKFAESHLNHGVYYQKLFEIYKGTYTQRHKLLDNVVF